MATHTVQINWTASADAVSGYNVYEGTAPGNESATAVNGATLITGNTYTATVPAPGVYSFVVTSVENGAESVHSNEIIATVKPFPPTAVILGTIN
jgi:hypothetical protein